MTTTNDNPMGVWDNEEVDQSTDQGVPQGAENTEQTEQTEQPAQETQTEEQSAQETQTQRPAEESQPAQPAESKPAQSAAGIDPEALAAALVKAQQASQQQPSGQQPSGQPASKLSEAEFRKQVNYMEASPDQVNAILQGGEPAVAALNQVIQGTARQAMTLASMYTQQAVQQVQQQLMETIKPYMSMADNINQQSFEQEFLESNADLKAYAQRGPNGQSLLDFAADQLLRSGHDPKKHSRADNMAKIAESVRTMIKQFGVQPTQPQGGQNPGSPAQATPAQSQPAAGRPAMPTMSSGGQGGTQKPKGSGAATDGGAMDIWN